LKRLGDKGSARLYSACDPLLDRNIVIKVAKLDRNNEARAALYRRMLFYDSQLQAQLEEPCAVEVYRCCMLEKRPFKVMEALTGGGVRFSDDPALRTDELLLLTALGGVVKVLEKAALSGISHGAIEPENLLFNGEGVLKLINFRPPELAGEIPLSGDFRFMAPERLLDFELSPAADVYSLGVVLYTFLTNRHPMGEVTLVSELELVERQKKNPVPPIKNRAGFSDDALFELVENMLAARAADRPTWEEVASQLAAAARRRAARRDLKAALSRIGRKLHSGLVALQTGEFVAENPESDG